MTCLVSSELIGVEIVSIVSKCVNFILCFSPISHLFLCYSKAWVRHMSTLVGSFILTKYLVVEIKLDKMTSI